VVNAEIIDGEATRNELGQPARFDPVDMAVLRHFGADPLSCKQNRPAPSPADPRRPATPSPPPLHGYRPRGLGRCAVGDDSASGSTARCALNSPPSARHLLLCTGGCRNRRLSSTATRSEATRRALRQRPSCHRSRRSVPRPGRPPAPAALPSRHPASRIHARAAVPAVGAHR
jgi:hypothetical protein